MVARAFQSFCLRLALAIVALCAFAAPAQAEVQVHFHSFNGSMFGGRYPHTFVVFDGTLANGERVYENYGFSAKTAGPNVLSGPTHHVVMSEKERYIRTTNRHFTLTVSDDTYRRMKAEVIAWRDAPGKFYDLNTRNCIHFVGRMAELAGLKVEFPRDMLRKPKAWLNYVTGLNPQLGAASVR
jgi:hypothetical protein